MRPLRVTYTDRNAGKVLRTEEIQFDSLADEFKYEYKLKGEHECVFRNHMDTSELIVCVRGE